LAPGAPGVMPGASKSSFISYRVGGGNWGARARYCMGPATPRAHYCTGPLLHGPATPRARYSTMVVKSLSRVSLLMRRAMKVSTAATER